MQRLCIFIFIVACGRFSNLLLWCYLMAYCTNTYILCQHLNPVLYSFVSNWRALCKFSSFITNQLLLFVGFLAGFVLLSSLAEDNHFVCVVNLREIFSDTWRYQAPVCINFWWAAIVHWVVPCIAHLTSHWIHFGPNTIISYVYLVVAHFILYACLSTSKNRFSGVET